MGKIAGVYSSPRSHFVGSAFTVRVLLSSHRFDRHLTPSVMMNYADSTGFVRPPRCRTMVWFCDCAGIRIRHGDRRIAEPTGRAREMECIPVRWSARRLYCH